MPDIFSSSNTPPERVQIHRKHRLAHRVDEDGHLLDTNGVISSTHKSRDVSDYSHLMRDMEPTHSPFASFVAKPYKLKFSTQAPNEVVILLLRQHPVTQIWWIIIALLGVGFPFLLQKIDFFNFLPANYQMAAMVGWFLVLLGFIVEAFLKWYFNVYIITDERIIDVDFNSLLFRNISSAKIDNIEDTTAMNAGFLSAIFDFGTVVIQTAAEKREFEFAGIPHPSKVTTLINDLILEEEREKLEGRVS